MLSSMTTPSNAEAAPADLPETVPVREAHRFATDRLEEHLRRHDVAGRLVEVRQMRGGQSNPTFLLVTDRGELVMRKQPPGPLLPSAHAVDREFRVISALGATDVPVPQRWRSSVFSMRRVPGAQKKRRSSSRNSGSSTPSDQPM
jgi:hypothetical protein